MSVIVKHKTKIKIDLERLAAAFGKLGHQVEMPGKVRTHHSSFQNVDLHVPAIVLDSFGLQRRHQEREYGIGVNIDANTGDSFVISDRYYGPQDIEALGETLGNLCAISDLDHHQNLIGWWDSEAKELIIEVEMANSLPSDQEGGWW